LQTAAAVSAAAILLSACSSQPQGNSVGLPATAMIGNHTPWTVPRARGVRPAVTYRTVYLAEQSKNDAIALLLNKHGKFTEVGAVPGAPGGYGLWVDRERNLYVSNYIPGASEIFEYNDFEI
jgi:hypothetical protein